MINFKSEKHIANVQIYTFQRSSIIDKTWRNEIEFTLRFEGLPTRKILNLLNSSVQHTSTWAVVPVRYIPIAGPEVQSDLFIAAYLVR